jgi:hypothetical protein
VLGILKLLATSALMSGAMQARLRAAKQAAAAVTVLAAAGLIAAAVGAACLAAALYLALLRVMTDYEAALTVGGGFIALAGLALLLAVATTRRALSGRGVPPAAGAATHAVRPARSGPSDSGTDPLVALISESVQSPVVMSALALGVAVGRMTRGSKRD